MLSLRERSQPIDHLALTVPSSWCAGGPEHSLPFPAAGGQAGLKLDSRLDKLQHNPELSNRWTRSASRHLAGG